jgi:hypothetical protein
MSLQYKTVSYGSLFQCEGIEVLVSFLLQLKDYANGLFRLLWIPSSAGISSFFGSISKRFFSALVLHPSFLHVQANLFCDSLRTLQFFFPYIFVRNLIKFCAPIKSRDSAVGIATGCGLDDLGIEIRVPVGSRIFCSPLRPYRLWSPHNLLYNGYRGTPGGKAAGAWSSPLISN